MPAHLSIISPVDDSYEPASDGLHRRASLTAWSGTVDMPRSMGKPRDPKMQRERSATASTKGTPH